MEAWTSEVARKTFLDYFTQRGHQAVASSSLVPGNDPTLLFVNAGMVQFKEVFLGRETRPYKRATTSQKCMRISGKHNDLENVGPSPRHHTFFEMLGNFSFGDYFKEDAIQFAYDLITREYKLPEDRLYFTVYLDDSEALDIWTHRVGISNERILRMGSKTNFWQMADTGPCGPTSEIHFDFGSEYCTCHEPDCSVLLDNGCERWLEIWNLVFMQYNRRQPDPEHTGKFDESLPAPGVDTGMGLERILAVLNRAQANYDTDLFGGILDATQDILGHNDAFRQNQTVAYRVIADHARAATFLIADGVNPGTTGREYVVRMLIRRAWRFAHRMGVQTPFLSRVASVVIDKMSPIYSELDQSRQAIHYQIDAEERRFIKTLDRSLDVLEEKIEAVSDRGESRIAGEDVFFLYATHGLPMEITRDVVKERGLSVDEEGFRRALELHRELASAADRTIADVAHYQEVYDALGGEPIRHDPYNYDLLTVDTRVVCILTNGVRVPVADTGTNVEIVLAATPFYLESGGQISDTGTISGEGWKVQVTGMAQPFAGLILHRGEVVSGKVGEGSEAQASVDAPRRWHIMRNHTATHLLHAALRETLGEHVKQKGSLVAPDHLRFDFTHNKPLERAELNRVFERINQLILSNRPVQAAIRRLDEARRDGAMALFGEKYSETVRTITIVGEDGQRFSYELCGGTHVRSLGDIGPCVIVSEESSGSGVRRILAVTGQTALNLIQEQLDELSSIGHTLGVEPGRVKVRLYELTEELKESRAAIDQFQRDAALAFIDDLVSRAKAINGIKVIAGQVSVPNADLLAELADWCRNRLGSGIVVLGSEVGNKARLVAKVSPDAIKNGVNAGKLIATIAKTVSGGGGGSPDFATAGGNDPSQLPKAISQVEKVVRSLLK